MADQPPSQSPSDSRPAARQSERAVADLWSKAHALSDGLVTEDGRRLRVVYPGRPNPRAGPDFVDAVLTTGAGRQIVGDVELHVSAPDWYSHRHHLDPNYNGVILHVVLWPKGRATSKQESGTETPVAAIAAVSPSADARLPGTLAGLDTADDLGMGDVLDRAGEDRFVARSAAFAAELGRDDADQVLYRSLMEALGYASNRRPFRELAERVPAALLLDLRGEPASTRLMAITAMLLRGAGLLAWAEPPEEALRLRGLLRHLPRTGAMAAGRWNMFRVRPANHPARRVIGAAHLVDRYVESGLARGLERELRGGKARLLVQALAVRPFVGRDRACDLAVNVVLPLMHALAGIRRDAALAGLCLDLYRAFPRPADNEVTREMRRLLSSSGASVQITGARRHQGLMHLYKVVTGRTGG
ncbi:MAG: DUF2851 family protein [Chloroflexi bacterium]|nr:DUF2851 family protein [Chloroflexota bacterium]